MLRCLVVVVDLEICCCCCCDTVTLFIVVDLPDIIQLLLLLVLLVFIHCYSDSIFICCVYFDGDHSVICYLFIY